MIGRRAGRSRRNCIGCEEKEVSHAPSSILHTQLCVRCQLTQHESQLATAVVVVGVVVVVVAVAAAIMSKLNSQPQPRDEVKAEVPPQRSQEF